MEIEENNKFNYMMLDRLRTDCNYFLGNGNRHEKHLWADSVQSHIEEMKRIHNAFNEDEKPEWLSYSDILAYEKEMSK